MKSIQELQTEIDKNLDAVSAYRILCTRENREMTVAERKDAVLKLDRIDSLRDQMEIERRTQETLDQTERYSDSGPIYPELDSDHPHRSREIDFSKPATCKTYRGMFGKPGKSEFKSEADFFEALTSGKYDPRLARSAMVEGIGSLGGLTVPEEFASTWLDDSLPGEIVRNYATVWPMKSPVRKVPAWDDLTRSDGTTYGGLSIQWLGENQTASKKIAKTRQIKLSANKGAIYVDVSREIDADGFDFPNQLKKAIKKSLGFGLDESFLYGTGAGMPPGICNSANPALITVAKEESQTKKVVYENITNLYARMYGPGKNRAIWLASNDLIPELLEMYIVIGDSGSHVKVLNEINGNFSVFGRPVIFSEICPAAGSAGAISFIDFSQYYVGVMPEIGIEMSLAPGWTEDLISFRLITRIAGVGTWSKALTPKNGSTQSWAVTLGAIS